MLDKLNLQPIAPLGSAPSLRQDDLLPVCYVKVSKMGQTFLTDEAFYNFFLEATKKYLSSASLATCKQEICIRRDIESNIVAFSLVGADGAASSGRPFGIDQLNAQEEIAAIGIKAGANIQLFKASDYTLVARIGNEQLIEDPFKGFKNLLVTIGEACQRHSNELSEVSRSFERLTGRKPNCFGDSQLASIAARRILADARTVKGLQTTQQVSIPDDYRPILEAALELAVNGYTAQEKLPDRSPQCTADRIAFDKLIREVNLVYGTDIKPNETGARLNWQHGIAKSLRDQYFNYDEGTPKTNDAETTPCPSYVATTGNVIEDQYNFQPLEQVDATLFQLLQNAGFFVEKNECRRRTDIELPIEPSLLKAAIDEANLDTGIKSGALAVETARYYAKFVSKNKSVATRASLSVNFAQLTAALAHAYPTESSLQECNAFVSALAESFTL
ncbi:hypothetical protein R21Y_119 [Vibrio phage vB_VhaS_R21Y]|nr:hypothetical protein R21Y_119 [Vibrio phage vB_VhaS_R21Y]